MSLPASGPISFSEIQRVLGGSNPISLSEYYANAAGGYAAGVPGIPSTGVPIPVSAFRGKAKPVAAVEITKLMELTWTEDGPSAATTNGASVYSSEPIQYGSVANVFNQTGFMRSYNTAYDSSGNFLGSTSTALSNGETVKGAYFHITLDTPATFSRYTFPSNWDGDGQTYDNMAEWYIVGSTTGADGTWDVLDYADTDGLYAETVDRVLNPVGTYKNYRFIVSRIGGTVIQQSLYMKGFSMSTM